MARSPLCDAEGVVTLEVKANGVALADTSKLMTATVRRAVNQVPTATLVFADGDMPAQTFPLSDGQALVPGAKLVISAGYADRSEVIFEGIVLGHGLSIASDNDARLTLVCRDEAVRMTGMRKTRLSLEVTDSDAMTALITDNGLLATIETTTFCHPSLVQHDCTDWDYLVARAEAHGQIVVVTDGLVAVGAPNVAAAAELTVAYGESLIEFQADLDASHQFAGVTAQAWDPKTQSVLLSREAPPAALNDQGNLDAMALSKVLSLGSPVLQTGVALNEEQLDALAKAQQLKSGLSRLRGRMRFQGSALARVGGIIELKGVGERFNGMVFVTALTHHLEAGNWTTEVEFGLPTQRSSQAVDIGLPRAAGLPPGMAGLHAGVVLNLEEDPGGEARVQVQVPGAGLDRIWARLLQPIASDGFGVFMLPEVGDEVLLGWFNNDPNYPVVLGGLYSSKRRPPYAPEAGNHIKALVSRSKAKLEINDLDKVITLSTPGQNQVVLNDKDQAVVISDQHGNKVTLRAGGIQMESPQDIVLKAAGKIVLDALGEVSVTSQSDVKVSGLNVNCQAQVSLVAKGSASAELSAAGQTTVKGALVMIN